MTLASIRVITFSGRYGCGGGTVAAQLADRLGFRLLDRALIEDAARTAHCDAEVAARLDQQRDPWLHRLARSLWRGSFESVSALDEAEVVDADRLARLEHRLIEEAAEAGGCVVVGRGAPCVLRRRPDAFHVFLYGPRPDRLQRLRQHLPASTDFEARLEAVDAARGGYVRQHFGCAWDDPDLYHLMMSSEKGDDAVVAVVLAALAAFDTQA